MTPLGFPGALMLATACVEDTVWNLGALRPSGGAGPVLHRVQLLGAFPAEFTAQTFREKSVRPVKSRTGSGRNKQWATQSNGTQQRETRFDLATL